LPSTSPSPSLPPSPAAGWPCVAAGSRCTPTATTAGRVSTAAWVRARGRVPAMPVHLPGRCAGVGLPNGRRAVPPCRP
jgi:hypothetical protein